MSRGRRDDRWTIWREHVAAWKKSGLSQAEFCRQHLLDKQHFSLWKRKIERDKAGDSGSKLIELPVSVLKDRTSGVARSTPDQKGKITISVKENEIVISMER